MVFEFEIYAEFRVFTHTVVSKLLICVDLQGKQGFRTPQVRDSVSNPKIESFEVNARFGVFIGIFASTSLNLVVLLLHQDFRALQDLV